MERIECHEIVGRRVLLEWLDFDMGSWVLRMHPDRYRIVWVNVHLSLDRDGGPRLGRVIRLALERQILDQCWQKWRVLESSTIYDHPTGSGFVRTFMYKVMRKGVGDCTRRIPVDVVLGFELTIVS